MSRNGSGTYNLPAGNPVVTGTTISTTWANNTLNDIAATLTDSVAADGQTPMTGNLNLSNNKIVNVTDPTLAQDAATKAYVDAKTDGTAAGSFTKITTGAGTVLLPSITTTGDTNTGIYFPAADTIAFTEGGTEAMRITSIGQLLIGTSTAKNASAKLYIDLPQTTPTVDGAGFNLDVIDGTNYDNQSGVFVQGDGNILIAQKDASLGIGFYTTFFYNGAIVGQINGTGGTGVAYTTSSDYRLKENIAPMQGSLDKVVALKPVTYTWKKNGSKGQGFIAHELQSVVPECVTGEKDAVDSNGKPVYQGIDTSFLVATLTAAIQELKAELDSVKAELAALKA